jgi:hypothetical protein
MRGGVSYGFSLFKNAGSRPAPQKGEENKKKKKRKKRKENLIDSRIQPFLFPRPFPVSAQEFFGYQGNCIYFTDYRSQSCVFKLKDHNIGHLAFFTAHSRPFCPPPTWLSATNPRSSTC